jgi:hypothetical protein
MVPIFEQGTGRGIGHNVDSFRRRFAAICEEHVNSGRAKAFAFIFYDFTDESLCRLLHDQGVFTQLDRLAGDKLSIFFLHSGTRKIVESFNSEFLSQLGLPGNVALPAIVFFKLEGEEIADISVAQLNSSDLIHGFHEVYQIIQSYIADKIQPTQVQRHSIRWIKSTLKFIGSEMFQAMLERLLQTVY